MLAVTVSANAANARQRAGRDATVTQRARYTGVSHVARYIVRLHGPNGEVVVENAHDLDDDSVAIDYVADLEHPHEINLWAGERLVARFGPLQPRPES